MKWVERLQDYWVERALLAKRKDESEIRVRLPKGVCLVVAYNDTNMSLCRWPKVILIDTEVIPVTLTGLEFIISWK